MLKEAPTSIFRKLAIGTWKTTYHPATYGTIEVQMNQAESYIQDFRRATGRRLTVSHLLIRAVAEMFRRVPEANALLRFNRIYLRPNTNVFVNVALNDPKTKSADLSGVTVCDVEGKTLVEIVEEMDEKVQQVRSGHDEQLAQGRRLVDALPPLLLNPIINGLSFVVYSLNLDMKRFGIPNDVFGAALITNIGTYGLDKGFVPLVPYTRAPIVLAYGAVTKKPVVENDQIVIRKMMSINATFDHRIFDGYHAAVMGEVVRSVFEDPYRHLDAIEGDEQTPRATTTTSSPTWASS
jgi:pyruvate dehydrogenase E2 component (dihydrolipoamide acetyltransferase)